MGLEGITGLLVVHPVVCSKRAVAFAVASIFRDHAGSVRGNTARLAAALVQCSAAAWQREEGVLAVSTHSSRVPCHVVIIGLLRVR